jgi:predicted nucleic acid-binding protein
MALDPAKFSKMSVVDTCAVWNMLSSRKIYQASVNAKLHFCITPMVLYECLHKPRSSMTSEKTELIRRMEQARENGGFPIEKCDLDDLVAVVQQSPKGLNSGEISCIATAYGIRSIALMTDESKARKFAAEKLGLAVETTPKLYAWLHFYRHLNDGDHDDVIREHELYEKKIPLTSFFKEAYKEAMRCRLMLSG